MSFGEKSELGAELFWRVSDVPNTGNITSNTGDAGLSSVGLVETAICCIVSPSAMANCTREGGGTETDDQTESAGEDVSD